MTNATGRQQHVDRRLHDQHCVGTPDEVHTTVFFAFALSLAYVDGSCRLRGA